MKKYSPRAAKTKPRACFCGDDCGRRWTNDDENVTMAKFSLQSRFLSFWTIIYNLWWLHQRQTAMSRLPLSLFMATTSLLAYAFPHPCDFATDFNGFFNGILLRTLTEVYFLKRFFVACSCVCVFDSMRDFRHPGLIPFVFMLFHCVLLECRFTWTQKARVERPWAWKKQQHQRVPKNWGEGERVGGWKLRIENRAYTYTMVLLWWKLIK